MTLKLNPAPTFRATVRIQVPGEDDQPVEFEFRHRDKAALEEFFQGEGAKTRSDLDTVMGMVVTWNPKHVDADFSRENMEKVLKNYHTAAKDISSVYTSQLLKVRLGN